MSSPVDGMAGAIPLIGGGAPAIVKGGIVPRDQGNGVISLNVDLRWLNARVLRAGATTVGVHGVHAESLLQVAGNGGWTPASPLGYSSLDISGYSAVVNLLRTAGTSDAAR